ncbi:MAG: glucose-1-phosphate cytidylyltransferase [Rhodospirillaceae bacterium]|nr:glucose-1-phosphate cytidylyltransferase [Rhodospirillales bacterium]
MQAVILCGGQGTRLREETEFKPKPMVSIGPHPILWHIMRHYASFAVKDFILCLGYKGEIIRDYFLNYRAHTQDVYLDLGQGTVEALPREISEPIDWRVMLTNTGLDTMTGRRVLTALEHVEGETFFATYGDGVANVDLSALLAHHRCMGKLATVTAVHPAARFGEMSLRDGLVTSFTEKPQVAEGWINGGFFVFEKRAFADLPARDDLILETDVLERLAANGQLAVHRHEGFWQCMDTFREMQLLNTLWSQGRAPWKTW